MSANLDDLKTAADFYKFFDAIPDEKWTTEKYQDGDRFCALGHCGAWEDDGVEFTTNRSNMLVSINGHRGKATQRFGILSDINDGKDSNFPQSTPKARILAMLKEAEACEKIATKGTA